jgi:hypothetical protein
MRRHDTLIRPAFSLKDTRLACRQRDGINIQQDLSGVVQEKGDAFGEKSPRSFNKYG